jgi:hypothetical protein
MLNPYFLLNPRIIPTKKPEARPCLCGCGRLTTRNNCFYSRACCLDYQARKRAERTAANVNRTATQKASAQG